MNRRPGSIIGGRDVRSRATVIVATAVDGTTPKRGRDKRPRVRKPSVLKVDPRIMEVRPAARPGEAWVIVSPTEVRTSYTRPVE